MISTDNIIVVSGVLLLLLHMLKGWK